MCSFQADARIDATAGLQISQPAPLAVARQQVVEGLELVQAHQVVELLARVREVLAQVVADRDAGLLQLELQQIADSSVTHEPQPVPALVQAFRAGTACTPSAMA